MDAERRAKRIALLDERRIRGNRADAQRQAIDGLLADRQAAYLKSLVSTSRTDGAVAEAEVWKLVALDDIRWDLEAQINAGRSAEGELADIAEQAREEIEHG